MTLRIVLRDQSQVAFVHEWQHVLHRFEIGDTAYGRLTKIEREMWVMMKILEGGRNSLWARMDKKSRERQYQSFSRFQDYVLNDEVWQRLSPQRQQMLTRMFAQLQREALLRLSTVILTEFGPA